MVVAAGWAAACIGPDEIEFASYFIVLSKEISDGKLADSAPDLIFQSGGTLIRSKR